MGWTGQTDGNDTAQSGNHVSAQAIETVGVLLPPTPRGRLRLGSLREVRREMAKVYAEARSGEMKTDVASRLVYILTQLSNLIRDSELEQRVQELEQEIARR